MLDILALLSFTAMFQITTWMYSHERLCHCTQTFNENFIHNSHFPQVFSGTPVQLMDIWRYVRQLFHTDFFARMEIHPRNFIPGIFFYRQFQRNFSRNTNWKYITVSQISFIHIRNSLRKHISWITNMPVQEFWEYGYLENIHKSSSDPARPGRVMVETAMQLFQVRERDL